MKIHYLPHTHWDREWLRSSDASRIKLVYFFDRLIQMMKEDPEFHYFTFDGQTAGLEDYLQIRPDQRQVLCDLIRNKRLFIGPWYCQPDMFLASGESLLRNLLVGSDYADRMGHCMEVGWIPDAFGQIAKTPELFKALGCKAVFIWRGFDYDKIDDSIFLWRSDNGDELLSVHFPLGYGYARYLPEDVEEAYKELSDTIGQITGRFSDGHLLCMGGGDYAFPQVGLPGIIKKLKDKFPDDTIELSNPEMYIEQIQKTLSQHPRKLQVYQGESRSSALGRIHAGISSTRIDIKNQMKYYETLLAQVIEPMSVANSWNGGEFTQEMLTYFWKILFKNQFHDSAYSSSPETVNQTVENRLLNLRHGTQELLWMNLRYVFDEVNLTGYKEGEGLLLLYNTLPYRRCGVAFADMIVKEETFCLRDHIGRIIPYQRIKNPAQVNEEVEYYHGIPDFHDSGELIEGTKKRVQIYIDASMLPPLGYQMLRVCFGKQPPSLSVTDLKRTGPYSFENAYISIQIHENGTLRVCDKESKQEYTSLHYFEDKGDDGDEYNYSPPRNDQVLTTLDSHPDITLLEEGPYVIRYRITYRMRIPSACVDHRRSEDRVINTIISDVSLTHNSHRIDFCTKIDNHAKDHMIRVVFQDRNTSEWNCSQDAFGVTIRNNRILKQKGIEHGAVEEELPIYPMQRFVKLHHEAETFALISKGPCEYEVYDNQKIALTLLRSVGKFGKADLMIRPGRASGYRLDTPSSQLLKTVESSYSLYLKKHATIADLAREASMVNADISSRFVSRAKKKRRKNLPWRNSFIELDEGLELIACKQAEDGDDSILRILNPGTVAVYEPYCKVPYVIKKCYLSDVRERKGKEIATNQGYIRIPCIPAQSFITLRLERSC